MSYEILTPKDVHEPQGFEPGSLRQLTPQEIIARTVSVGATTHINGQRLERPLPDNVALKTGQLALHSHTFWEDGLEPQWFCFTD